MGKFKLSTIHLDGKGSAKVLGELESKIMELLWKQGDLTVRQTRDLLAKKHKDWSFNSIMTIMNRLVDKGLLKKKEKDGVFLYAPTLSKKEFSKAVTKNVFLALLKDPSFFGAVGFSELAQDLDKQTLDRLKQIIK